MVEIVKLLGWSYISIIYEESNYGVKAFEELEELLAEHNVCIAGQKLWSCTGEGVRRHRAETADKKASEWATKSFLKFAERN
jgi:hypothetical protein